MTAAMARRASVATRIASLSALTSSASTPPPAAAAARGERAGCPRCDLRRCRETLPWPLLRVPPLLPLPLLPLLPRLSLSDRVPRDSVVGLGRCERRPPLLRRRPARRRPLLSLRL